MLFRFHQFHGDKKGGIFFGAYDRADADNFLVIHVTEVIVENRPYYGSLKPRGYQKKATKLRKRVLAVFLI